MVKMQRSGKIHFIGAGGIGMRGLVKLCLLKGWKVSASERKLHPELEKELLGLGLEILSEQENLADHGVSCVVYSTAVSRDHPQRKWANEKGLLMHRSECLAQLFHDNHERIAVAGSHGKTTCSSWLAYTLYRLKGSGFCVGGIVSSLESTADLGKGESFVIEADESDGSFINYDPTHLLVTNLDVDHMDHWKTAEALFAGMQAFSSKAKNLVICSDDNRLKAWNLPALRYGFEPDAQLRIERFTSNEKGSEITLSLEKHTLGTFNSKLWGKHNALNLAGVVGVCLSLGLDIETCKPFIESFEGAKRRLEFLGIQQTVAWYDDYAHHPNEIQATLKAIRDAIGSSKQLRVIFQPHRPSRLRDLLEEFANSFYDASDLWLVPLYLSNEMPIEGIHSDLLKKRIEQTTPEVKLRLFSSLDEAQETAKKDLSTDFCLTMGAGDITYLGRAILEKSAVAL